MIRAVLVGDDRLKQWISTRYPQIEDALQKSMGRIVIALARKIKGEKLSGQVLKNRTGTLRRSISPEVQSSGATITGTVSTNLEYAAAHEYGFHGVVTVRAHLRQIRERGKMVLRSVKGHNMKVYYKQRGKLTGGAAQVRAHSRKVNLPERSFMRTALAEMEPEIREEFRDAIARVIRA